MKKIFCFVLALVLCLSAVVTAGATELPETDDYSMQVARLITMTEADEELDLFNLGYVYEEFYRHYSSEDEAVPDYVFVFAQTLAPFPLELDEQVGDYYFHQASIGGVSMPTPDTQLNYFVYVPAENVLYTALEACDMGFEDLNIAFASAGENCALVGDAHRDFVLNIKDATALQKYIAGMDVPWDCNVWEYYVFDFNGDKDVDIKDATAIQKHLAGIVE